VDPGRECGRDLRRGRAAAANIVPATTGAAIAVARAILRDGEVRHETVGLELLTCEKCVHPGVASLWEFHQAGDPARVAQRHDGCGAAIRVAPVAIIYSSDRLEQLVTERTAALAGEIAERTKAEEEVKEDDLDEPVR